MLSSFENFGFKEKVESLPFWKTFCFENVVKVSRFGKLSRNFKTTNYTNYHESFNCENMLKKRNTRKFVFNKNREIPFLSFVVPTELLC